MNILQSFGLIASLLFFSRFYFQWITSEKRRESYVTATFWYLSLAANIAMAIHGFIQFQYPILLIQTCNGVISWRNLDLMRPLEKRTTLKKMLLYLLGLIACVTAAFSWRLVANEHFFWMASPALTEDLSFLWHLFGLLGMLLFASRFWIQWWHAEKDQKSHLPSSFWWISLIGALFSLLYFIRLLDFIQILSYGLGLLPYTRNLFLLKKAQKKELKKDSIFLVSGEKSGDLLGGELAAALKKNTPSLVLKGVGGTHMKNSGVDLFLPLEKLNVMGFTDVLRALPRLFFSYRKIKRKILNERPEKVILIDYPEFNIYLAKKLRKSGYDGKLIHYVSPTVWAWRPKRVFKLSSSYDLLLSILPFEKKYYEKTKLPVVYIGHPLVATLQNWPYKPSWKQTKGIKTEKILSIFPGSRPHAVMRNLPIQLEVAQKWLGEHPDFSLAISTANPEIEILIQKELSQKNISALLIPSHERYDLMRASTLALATSGTVTLELALHSVPTLVSYLLTPLNYFLGRYIFKIHLPYYCIVNVLAQEELFPEFFNKTLSPDTLYHYLTHLYHNPPNLSPLHTILTNQDSSLSASLAIKNL